MFSGCMRVLISHSFITLLVFTLFADVAALCFVIFQQLDMSVSTSVNFVLRHFIPVTLLLQPLHSIFRKEILDVYVYTDILMS